MSANFTRVFVLNEGFREIILDLFSNCPTIVNYCYFCKEILLPRTLSVCPQTGISEKLKVKN